MHTTPSQVVDFIDRVYPWANEDQESVHLERPNAPTVGAILALVDQVPAQCLAAMPQGRQTDFTAAIGVLRYSLAMWQAPSHPGYQHQLGKRGELGNHHPIHTLRAFLVACPDSAPAPGTPSLAFLADAEFERDLQLDISTSHSAQGNGEFKAACVIAGSVIEALLLWALARRTPADREAARLDWAGRRQAKGQQAPGPLPTEINTWTLEQCIEIGRRALPLPDEAAEAATLARNFRNLIHPGRALRMGQRPSLASASLAVGAMERIVEELQTLHQTGQL